MNRKVYKCSNCGDFHSFIINISAGKTLARCSNCNWVYLENDLIEKGYQPTSNCNDLVDSVSYSLKITSIEELKNKHNTKHSAEKIFNNYFSNFKITKNSDVNPATQIACQVYLKHLSNDEIKGLLRNQVHNAYKMLKDAMNLLDNGLLTYSKPIFKGHQVPYSQIEATFDIIAIHYYRELNQAQQEVYESLVKEQENLKAKAKFVYLAVKFKKYLNKWKRNLNNLKLVNKIKETLSQPNIYKKDYIILYRSQKYIIYLDLFSYKYMRVGLKIGEPKNDEFYADIYLNIAGNIVIVSKQTVYI